MHLVKRYHVKNASSWTDLRRSRATSCNVDTSKGPRCAMLTSRWLSCRGTPWDSNDDTRDDRRVPIRDVKPATRESVTSATDAVLTAA